MRNIMLQRHEGIDTSVQKYAFQGSFGSQLLTNGTFPANITTGWTNISTGTGTATWNSSGHVSLTYVDASDLGGLRQGPLNVIAGNSYILTVVNASGANGTVKLGFSAGGTQDGTASLPSAGGTTTLTFIAVADLLYIDVIAATGGVSPLVLNSVSVIHNSP